jgi:enoyl-CoA hydratase
MGDRYDLEFFRTEMREPGILWVTLDRPQRRNAISPEMHEELAPLFRRIAADREVRVAVITGAGDKAFCVGADFGGMQENLDAGGYEDGHPALMNDSAAIVRAQLAVPQPIIAALNGDAIGLGATLALFCDLVLMADHARLGDPHVSAGLVAGDGGAILWPLLLGPHRGKEVLMLGDLISAADADRLGLVNALHPASELTAEAEKLAGRLANGPRVAIEFNKRLANADILDRVNRLLDSSLALEALTFESADHKEAVSAFQEKRVPVFGRGAK